jgi:3'-phosphoadenosine 5'-phosphosulfate sulfotransferase (PAPS reductase)/FAD synthetase
LPPKWRFLVDAPFPISDRCCEVLKEGPLDRYMRDTGKKPITGEMAVESQNRRWSYLREGCNAFNRHNPRSRPLGFWTNQDVLQYIKERNLPYCDEVYGDIVEENGLLRCTKASRMGCMFCGFGAQRDENDRFEQLRIQHPKLYNYGMDKLGLRDVIDYIKTNTSRCPTS